MALSASYYMPASSSYLQNIKRALSASYYISDHASFIKLLTELGKDLVCIILHARPYQLNQATNRTSNRPFLSTRDSSNADPNYSSLSDTSIGEPMATSSPNHQQGSQNNNEGTHGRTYIFPPELGYDVIRRDREGDAHGGVLIAATTELGLNHLHTNGDSELNSGSINISPRKKVILSCLYRPPNRQDQHTTDKVIHNISELRSQHKNNIFILGGDFNLPDIDWDKYAINGSQTSREINNAFMQMTADLNLQQVVDIPTRGENILDLLLTSHPGQLSRCKTIPPLGNSDHDVVLLDFTTHISRPRPKRRTIYLWKKANTNGIRDELQSQLDTFTHTNYEDVNSMWGYIKDLILGAVKHHVPSRRTLAKHTHPWMTSELRRLSNRKQKAYKRAKRSKDSKDNKRYKALKGKQDSSQIVTLKSKDGFLRSDIASKASILNEQFQSVYTQEDLSPLPDLGPSPFLTMDNITINERGILKLLQGLRPFKATGPDEIPAFILKQSAESIAPYLTRMFQLSLDYGQKPDEWPCKLLEHVVHSTVMDHFDRNNILCDEQHGFRARRSCETQLVITLDQLARNMDQGYQTDVILLDFSKAFDKVPHQRLLLKLEHYGVSGTTLGWIKDFLSRRTQSVIRNQRDADKLQKDLTALEGWEKKWQMCFHPEKCTVIRISNKRQPLQTSYTLHGHQLEVVESGKYLGVTISQDLQWNNHIHNKIGKATRILGFLRRNLGQCTPSVKATAYCTMIRPSTEYASPVWDPYQTNLTKDLEQVQRRAARFVFNQYTDTFPGCVTSLLEQLEWGSLQHRRTTHRLVLCYKIRNRLVDNNPDKYYTPGDRRTRGSHRYRQHRAIKETRIHSSHGR
ncbi:uncharacterized protein LOC134237333 [Saccostrea cucullata]|uniref:uncharacterized protein LOC134237333 n=1 Tax=Saccostrea cuccullata TaxID=36930 RepID=UPI002ED01D99